MQVDQHQELTWLSEQRTAAQRRFIELGIPTLRSETWRFNDLRQLRAALTQTGSVKGTSVTRRFLAAYRLDDVACSHIFVDGHFTSGLSKRGALPPGIWLASLTDTARHRPDLLMTAISATDVAGAQALASLNAATFTDGMVLAVPPGVTLSSPIELMQCRAASGGPPIQLRHIMLLGAGSKATIVETATGVAGGCSNTVTTITLGDRAQLTHVKLQAEPETAVHLAQTRATVGYAAALEQFILILGGHLSHQEIHTTLVGEGARFSINGNYVLRGTQEATIAPVVDHQASGGQTQKLFKGVLNDSAHGVFLGTIVVREGADRTDAHQQNRNLLTSPTARVDTRPQLEIYADEVKCSHGATVGDLDDAALFYLQARGIDLPSARRMLIEAFATEAIDQADLPRPIDAWLRRHLITRLADTGEMP